MRAKASRVSLVFIFLGLALPGVMRKRAVVAALRSSGGPGRVLTLLDAVLLGTALVLLLGNTLNALVVVVLGGGALLRVGALCRQAKGSAPTRGQARLGMGHDDITFLELLLGVLDLVLVLVLLFLVLGLVLGLLGLLGSLLLGLVLASLLCSSPLISSHHHGQSPTGRPPARSLLRHGPGD